MGGVCKIYLSFFFKNLIVLVSFLSATLIACAQETDIKFTHISVNEGLSHLVANFVNQDESGFIWIGTHDGLNRYDGHKFKTYYNIPDNSNSLSDNIVNCFLQEDKDVIWIGTDEGINKFNPLINSVERFVYKKNDSTSLSNNLVNSIVKDDNGVLWVGTDDGLNKFSPKTGLFQRFFTDDSKAFSSEKNRIQKLYIDNHNNLWVKTIRSIYKMDLRTQNFQKVIELQFPEKIVGAHYNFGMLQLDSGELLIGSSSGLYIYDYSTQKSIIYAHDSNNSMSISDNIVTSIFQDNQGTVWVGTVDGLNKFDKKSGYFYHYKQNVADSKSLSNNTITSIFQDKSGAIWVGTYGSGVNRFNPFSKNFHYFKTPDWNIKNPNDKSVWAVVEDRNKNIWWGTNHGLYVVNESTGEIKYFGVDTIENKGVIQEFVGALYEDTGGNLWIGTDRGICVLDVQTVAGIFNPNIYPEFIHIYSKERVLTFLENVEENKMWVGVFDKGLLEFNMTAIENENLRDPKYIFQNNHKFEITKITVTQIFKKDSILWLGSKQGMFKYDFKNEKIKQYNYREGDKKSISNNKVYGIKEGKGNTLWLSTYGGGVNKFNIKTEEVQYYTTKDGLLNNGVYNLLIDRENNIWVSTNNGLSKFNPKTETFKNYNENDGVQGNEFNQGAFHMSESGRMYFGGNDGFNAFYPNKIDVNQVVPEVVFTDLSIFNTVIQPKKTFSELGISEGSGVVLEESINMIEKINLSYAHSVFSIEFAATHYLNPKRNDFKYKLEGFDENWVSTNSNNRKVTYTNLDPGDYTFKVKSANKDGVWNTVPKELRIVITPPFWKTNLFYLFSVLLFLTILYIVFKIRIGQVKLQHFQSQDELKTTMLKEIHHRVKNNLQIVSSLIRMQSSTMNDLKAVEVFKKVQSRVLSMAKLHEEMYKTDNLHQIDAKIHIKKLVTDLVLAYKVDNEINLEFDLESVEFNMDTLIPLGLIINEIIVNSLKYAFVGRDKGTITVKLKKTGSKKEYELFIGDNGKGIRSNEDSSSMGAKLIRSLVRQLNGSIELLKAQGAVYKIIFKSLK